MLEADECCAGSAGSLFMPVRLCERIRAEALCVCVWLYVQGAGGCSFEMDAPSAGPEWEFLGQLQRDCFISIHHTNH